MCKNKCKDCKCKLKKALKEIENPVKRIDNLGDYYRGNFRKIVQS